MHRIYIQLDGGSHCLRLPLVRNDAQDFAALEYLFNRHRYRLSRNFGNAFEPTLTDLLLATCVVEVNDDVWFVDLEIRRRIIECEVSVFADADERYVNSLLRNQLTNASTFVTNVTRLAID